MIISLIPKHSTPNHWEWYARTIVILSFMIIVLIFIIHCINPCHSCCWFFHLPFSLFYFRLVFSLNSNQVWMFHQLQLVRFPKRKENNQKERLTELFPTIIKICCVDSSRSKCTIGYISTNEQQQQQQYSTANAFDSLFHCSASLFCSPSPSLSLSLSLSVSLSKGQSRHHVEQNWRTEKEREMIIIMAVFSWGWCIIKYMINALLCTLDQFNRFLTSCAKITESIGKVYSWCKCAKLTIAM